MLRTFSTYEDTIPLVSQERTTEAELVTRRVVSSSVFNQSITDKNMGEIRPSRIRISDLVLPLSFSWRPVVV